MEKLKAKWMEMNLYRRVLLAVMLAEIFGFFFAAILCVNRPGLEYGGTLLYPRAEVEFQIYEGKLDGEPARLPVSPEGEVAYQWGEYSYGPWQVTVNSAAFPETLGDHDGTHNIGLEIRRGDEVLFRGGYRPGSTLSLYAEDGEPLWNVNSYATTTDGTTIEGNGREISQVELHEPALSAVARVVLAPELTHRGSLLLWFGVTLIALLNIFQLCLPGFFFRLSLWGHVRNIDDAEPADWYIAMEHIEWAALSVICLVLYWQALRVIV